MVSVGRSLFVSGSSAIATRHAPTARAEAREVTAKSRRVWREFKGEDLSGYM
jgi:hypothetical protein